MYVYCLFYGPWCVMRRVNLTVVQFKCVLCFVWGFSLGVIMAVIVR
jgi:hypothetical protein